jgi:hypothetical protein
MPARRFACDECYESTELALCRPTKNRTANRADVARSLKSAGPEDVARVTQFLKHRPKIHAALSHALLLRACSICCICEAFGGSSRDVDDAVH